MKKNLFSQCAILLTVILTTILLSCSRDKTALIPTAGETTANASDERTGNWGSITGMILPLKVEVKIAVYNRNFSSTSFYYNKDGSFRCDRIPKGIYDVIIIDLTTSREYLISGIKVGAGTVINIGVIKLQ